MKSVTSATARAKTTRTTKIPFMAFRRKTNDFHLVVIMFQTPGGLVSEYYEFSPYQTKFSYAKLKDTAKFHNRELYDLIGKGKLATSYWQPPAAEKAKRRKRREKS